MSVTWIYAANASRFDQDFKSIAEAFRLPGRDNANTDVLGLVYHFLEYEYKNSWLRIVDNLDNNEILNATSTGITCLEYIPDRNLKGRVLFTSRNREVCLNLVDEPILIPSMSTAEASDLLGERILQPSTPDEQLLLFEELDHLPLAIIQAKKNTWLCCGRQCRNILSSSIRAENQKLLFSIKSLPTRDNANDL